MTHSINTEISKLLVGVVLFVALFFSSLIFLYSWMIEDNIFNRQVADEADFIQQTYDISGQVTSPRPAYMSLHPNWQGLPTEFQLRFKQDPNLVEVRYADGRTVHIQVIKLANIDHVLVADVEGYEVSRDYFSSAVVWVGVIILVTCFLVALVALIKAKKITNPLNKLAEQVAKNESLQATYIGNDYPNNEIGLLANKIREVLINLSNAWNREVNFTKDVSHEIRTPVAVSKNILAQPLSKITDVEWQQLQTENLRIEQITQTLLALARDESTHTKRVNLTALIEHCLLTNLDINHTEKGKAIRFQLVHEQDVFKQINQHLIEIMVNNLLSNIVHYSSAADVSIKVTDTYMSLQNSFQGQVPTQPNLSGQKGALSQGLGHGLNIVERIAEVYEWSIDLDVNESTFTLTINY